MNYAYVDNVLHKNVGVHIKISSLGPEAYIVNA